MADVKLIATVYPAAASNTSLSSAFQVPGEFSHYFIKMPTTASWSVTTTGGVALMIGETETGTFYQVAYSSNPSTSTTGSVNWISGNDAGGKMIICEGLAFSPGWAKLQFTTTATAQVAFSIYGRKFD